jgi:hypothetical protein
MALQADGKLVVAGYLAQKNGVVKNYLFRLFATDSLPKPLSIAPKTPSKIQVFPNPAQDVLNIQSPEPIQNIQVYDALGRSQKVSFSGPNQLNITGLPMGLYLLRVRTPSGTQVAKWYKD